MANTTLFFQDMLRKGQHNAPNIHAKHANSAAVSNFIFLPRVELSFCIEEIEIKNKESMHKSPLLESPRDKRGAPLLSVSLPKASSLPSPFAARL